MLKNLNLNLHQHCYLCALLVFSGCQSVDSRKASETTQSSRDCDAMADALPDLQSEVRVVEGMKQAGGYVVSYGATGFAYIADTVVYVPEFILKSAVYCPGYVLSLAYGHIPATYCNPKHPNDRATFSKFGESTYMRTVDLRKRDYSEIYDATTEVVDCYENRGDENSLNRASEELLKLQHADFFQTLPYDKRARIDDTVKRIQEKRSLRASSQEGSIS